ncbi:hypothetical protein [Luedemannella flava]|uniref:hypothetical protein n=1 Tax=Luedemannella flava TaxID=349316 RepID=UPI0031D47163
MASLLESGTVTLELRDGVPVITLAVEVPAEDLTGEWSVLNRLMMLVVDGPGDAGFLCRRLGPEGDLAPAGWDEAFDRAAGAHVVFGTTPDAPTLFARTAD